MTRAMRACLILLTLIGVYSATQRLFILRARLSAPAEHRSELTAIEIRNVDAMSFLNGATRGTARRAKLDTFVNSVGDRWTHPWYAVMHLVPGILLFLLMPIQLSDRVRARWIRYHRWAGRAILLLGVGIVISSVYFGIINPQVAVIEAPSIAIFATLFVAFGALGFAAIRRKDRTTHREWMIRLYALTVGIATVRVVSAPLAFVFRDGDEGIMLMTSMWIGWLLTLGVAEWWIRRTRPAALAQ